MFSQCEQNSAHNVEDKCKRRRLLSSMVLMSSLVLIAFIIARTNEGMRTKQIFWVPFETAHK